MSVTFRITVIRPNRRVPLQQDAEGSSRAGGSTGTPAHRSTPTTVINPTNAATSIAQPVASWNLRAASADTCPYAHTVGTSRATFADTATIGLSISTPHRTGQRSGVTNANT